MTEGTPASGIGITQEDIDRTKQRVTERAEREDDHEQRRAQLKEIREAWRHLEGRHWALWGTAPARIFNLDEDNHPWTQRQLDAELETVGEVLRGIAKSKARDQLAEGETVITDEDLDTMLRKWEDRRITSKDLEHILKKTREAAENEEEEEEEGGQGGGYSTKKKRKRKRETKKRKRKRKTKKKRKRRRKTKKQKRKREEEKRARAHSRKKAKRR